MIDSTQSVKAYIALGANLGDAQTTLCVALREIAALPLSQHVKTSSLYRSLPFGENADGPDYINAVVAIYTGLPPHQLLNELQNIEQIHGRERHYQNAPRTLDLDILLYGDLWIQDERLTLPHPRMHERAFVLLPLSDIDMQLSWRDAYRQYTLNQLLPTVADQKIAKID